MRISTRRLLVTEPTRGSKVNAATHKVIVAIDGNSAIAEINFA